MTMKTQPDRAARQLPVFRPRRGPPLTARDGTPHQHVRERERRLAQISRIATRGSAR